MQLDVDTHLTLGMYGLYEVRRWRTWHTPTLYSHTPVIPFPLQLDVDDEVFAFAYTPARLLLSTAGKECLGRELGKSSLPAVKDINSRTSLLSSKEHTSVLLSIEHVAQFEVEINQCSQTLSDFTLAFWVKSWGMELPSSTFESLLDGLDDVRRRISILLNQNIVFDVVTKE
ncbi:hypothetical protein DFH29DRAFT_881113 [Suillus ampliporus]|nr:hypothetical protein DFH29DRAFT_881113 [Suillus ampliporus]